MAVRVTFTDNSDKILTKLNGNVEAALEAMGITAVNLTLGQMQSGYGKPIRQTGDLMRDVRYKVEASGKGTVDVGNSLDYAPKVHDGTNKMKGRPYLRDALSGRKAKTQLRNAVENELKKGF